jgi:hypothetical protein
MTREEILKAFLADQIFLDKGILKSGEWEKIRWSEEKNNDLIKVIKMVIEGEVTRESHPITIRKVNQLLG